MKQEQIDLLAREILNHKRLYYKGSPKITDAEYDILENQLKKYDPENNVLKMVGSDFFSSEKVAHEKKMLSLDKKYKFRELMSWAEQHVLLGLHKMDGTSASVIYNNGELLLVKTRGDGSFGENITAPSLYIDSILKNIPTGREMEIRGEIVCSRENFKVLSEEMVSRGLSKPKSPRNVVAGLLGRKDHIDLAKYLDFLAFDLIDSGVEYDKENEKVRCLEIMGFSLPEHKVLSGEKEVEDFLKSTKEKMDSDNGYLIDGAVLVVDSIGEQKKMGYTSHHPKYKMAFKFQNEGEVTTLNGIEWQISRFGVYTPVGIVEPVELDGATISKVTLHNLKTVKMFNLKKGDNIKIVRSGEVIPKFLEVVTSSDRELEFPSHCQYCNAALVEEDVRLVCENTKCSGRKFEYLLNFIQKIGIDDLSEKRVGQMIEAGLLNDIPDIYKMTKEDLMSLPGTKDRMAEKLLKNIEKTKNVDVVKFLSSLSFAGGARKSTELLMENGYDSFEKLFTLEVPDLLKIKGFAEKKAKDYVESLAVNGLLIEELLSVGVKVSFPTGKTSDSLSGLTFCITGGLELFDNRKALEGVIKSNGGKVSSAVSGQTSFLICNEESSSSKSEKAKSLGIEVLSEVDFKSRFL